MRWILLLVTLSVNLSHFQTGQYILHKILHADIGLQICSSPQATAFFGQCCRWVGVPALNIMQWFVLSGPQCTTTLRGCWFCRRSAHLYYISVPIYSGLIISDFFRVWTCLWSWQMIARKFPPQWQLFNDFHIDCKDWEKLKHMKECFRYARPSVIFWHW